MSVKKGDKYLMLGGHWLQVTTVKNIGYNNERRVFLSCAPGCCHKPLHVKLEILEKDLKKLTLDKDWR